MNCLATSCRRPGFSINVFKSDSHPGASNPVMDKCITIVPALSSSAASILCDFSRSSVDRSIWHLSIRNRWIDFQVTTQRNQVFQYKKLCTSSKDYGISIFLWRSILKGWGWQGKTLYVTLFTKFNFKGRTHCEAFVLLMLLIANHLQVFGNLI